MKAVAIYRMPEEQNFYALEAEKGITNDSENSQGFVFSAFGSEEVYSLIEPNILTNIWPSFSPYFLEEPEETSKQDYLQSVDAITKLIRQGEFKKLVFSRVKRVEKTNTLQVIFNQLCDLYPSAFVYCISTPETGTWMGATPEILVSKNGTEYQTVSLAGTRVNGVEWTEKERKEQQVVTDYITEKLAKYSSNLSVSEPYDLNTGTVIHLKSDIHFALSEKATNWEVIKSLNPTPAVCGIPTEKAKKKIEELEVHSRDLYTGFIGPMGCNNHQTVFVNLRCMQIHKNSISLYVGGGIMGDSIAENEWMETENKAKTLLKSL